MSQPSCGGPCRLRRLRRTSANAAQGRPVPLLTDLLLPQFGILNSVHPLGRDSVRLNPKVRAPRVTAVSVMTNPRAE